MISGRRILGACGLLFSLGTSLYAPNVTAAAATAVSGPLYFDAPVDTYPGRFYQLDNRGNGGYGGSISVDDSYIHLAEGAGDVIYYDYNLQTGTVIRTVNHPSTPDVTQGRKGQEIPAFTKAIVFLKMRADLLRDGISSPFQNQVPDPQAKSIADYLDLFVSKELNGGKAKNGIPFCVGNSYGTPYTCGDYLCAKADYEYKVPCVTDKAP